MKIPGYRLIDAKPWRSGGMAEIYRARNMRTDEESIIKILKAEFRSDPTVKTNFKREFLYANTLGQTNDRLAAAVAQGTLEDGRPYMVMQMLHGEDVGSLLKRAAQGKTRISVKLASHIAGEAAVVLHGLHNFPGHKIIHRDISPDNIVVEQDLKKVYLIDFGIATGLEGTMVPAGKPLYTAPEGYAQPSPASDIYALGVVLYLLLSGHSEWAHGTLQSTQSHGAVMQSVGRIHELRPDVPAWMVALLKQMLDRDPAKRPSAESVMQALYAGRSVKPNPGEIDVVHDRVKMDSGVSPLMQAVLLGISLVSLFLILIGLGLVVWWVSRPAPEVHISGFDLHPGNNSFYTNGVVYPLRRFRVHQNVQVKGGTRVEARAQFHIYEIIGKWGEQARVQVVVPDQPAPETHNVRFPPTPLTFNLGTTNLENGVEQPLILVEFPAGATNNIDGVYVEPQEKEDNPLEQYVVLQKRWGEKSEIRFRGADSVTIQLPFLNQMRGQERANHLPRIFPEGNNMRIRVDSNAFERVAMLMRDFDTAQSELAAQWNESSIEDEHWMIPQRRDLETWLHELRFSDNRGEAYVTEIRDKWTDFKGRVSVGDESNILRQRFWLEVFNDAVTKGEPAVQRGALLERARSGVSVSEFSASELDLFTNSVNKVWTNDSRRMEFHWVAASVTNAVLADALNSYEDSQMPMASLLPHQFKAQIRYVDEAGGIDLVWTNRFLLVPDMVAGSLTNPSAFYMMETEFAYGDLQIAGDWWAGLAGESDVSTNLAGRLPSPFERSKPVRQATPAMAEDFSHWLSDRCGYDRIDREERLTSVRGFGLPSAEEWGFAALFGSPSASEDRIFWNQLREDIPREIGTGDPYPLGFKNLSGNVWELTRVADGEIVAQGGSYLSETDSEIHPSHTRSLADVRDTLRHEAIGFRLVFRITYIDFSAKD